MNVIKEIGKMMVTLSIIATAIYILVEHTKEWPSTIVLAVFLVIWVQLVYHLFKIVRLNNKGIAFGSSFTENDSNDLVKRLNKKVEELSNYDKELQNRIEKAHRQLVELKKNEAGLQEQIKTINESVDTINKEISEVPKLTIQRVPTAELLETFYFTNGLEKFDRTTEPIDVESFHNTIEEAKKSNESFKENYYYKSIVDKYSEAFAYALIQKISSICETDELHKIEPTLYKAVKRPYSKATILAIKDELERNDNKAELTLEFEQFIKELDMLY